MNGITFLDNDTLILKVDKLEQMMAKVVYMQVKKLEDRISEIVSEQDKILTKKQVMEMLDISGSTYDNWVRKGTLKAHKIGDKPMVFLSDVRNSMKSVN